MKISERRHPSLAKLTPPCVDDVVGRDRLFKILDKACQKPLVWLSAPAGSGKTCLTASYVHENKLPCVWYSVDARDADPATFFHYLTTAAKKATPKKRKNLPQFTLEYFGGIPAFTRTLFEGIFNRLPNPSLIVFDNLQDAPGEILTSIISEACEVIPEDTTILCLSRMGPSDSFAKLDAYGSMVSIGWEELRLTTEECGAIAKKRGYINNNVLNKNKISQLNDQIEGWAAGLVLYLDHAYHDNDNKETNIEGAREKVFGYLATELFNKTEPRIRDLLLITAQLESFTPDIAARLTGLPRKNRIARELIPGQYFISRRESSSKVLTYHPLFRDFLLRMASEIYDPQELAVIQKKAAEILLETGQVDEAVELLQQAKCWDLLPEIINSEAQALLLEGRYAVLYQWIEYLPEELCLGDPWLLYWYGSSISPLNPISARELFSEAFHRFSDQDDLAGVYLAWCGVAESFFIEFSDYTPMVPWLEKIYQVLQKSPQFPSLEIEIQVTGSLLFAMVISQPDHPDIKYWNQRASDLLHKVTESSLRLKLGSSQIFYLMWNGYLQEAFSLIQSLRPMMTSSKEYSSTRITWYMFEAHIRWLITDFQGCIKAVETGLSIARDSGVHFIDGLLLNHGAYCSLCAADLTSAADYIARMEDTHPSHQLLHLSHYYNILSWEALLQDEPEKALQHATAGVNAINDRGVPVPLVASHIVKASALCDLKRYDEAEQQIEFILETAESMGSRLFMMHHRLLLAEILLGRGQKALGDEMLREAIRLGIDMGEINHGFWRPKAMTKLLIRALTQNIETDFVRQTIRARNLAPDTPPLEIETWPWKLKVYTLGRFEIVKDEKPLRFSGKAQKRPLEMLKALISLGGRGIGKQRLIKALWPDTDGDTANKSFDTTLHRLRKLLGDEQFIRMNDGKLDLDPYNCWIDLWAFERSLNQAVISEQKGDLQDAWQLTEKAMNMYHDDFLGREEIGSWVLPTRERLRSRSTRNLLQIAKGFRDIQDYSKAIVVYERALEIDRLAEDVYRCLMECYVILKRPAEGLAVYQRCRLCLGTILGIQPSPETVQLMEKLKEDN